MSEQIANVKLFVASPCYCGNVHVNYMQSVLGLQQLCDRLNIGFKFYTIPFDSLIPRARNVCANVFLQSDFTHLFFIDADIEFQPIQVIQMLKYDKDIICGAYPKKILNHELIKKHAKDSLNIPDLVYKSTSYAINFVQEDNKITIKNNLVEILDAPTGFLIIKRDVLNNIKNKNSSKVYINDIRAYGYGKEFYDFFPCGVFNNRYLSEDYGFCRLCQKLNYQIYCDVSVKLTHIGQFHYNGCLNEQLKLE